MKILLVEDEAKLSESIAAFLKKAGHVLETAFTLKAAENATLNAYDCVLLDIMLPDGDGLEIIRNLKKEYPETGIIVISAKDALDDKIKGLNLGADDYLTKPFHLSELNARINALGRRNQRNGANLIEFKEILIDPAASEARVNGKALAITRKEFELLLYFITNRNRVLSKQNLIEHLWEDHALEADSYDFVYTHIKNLRRKLKQAGAGDYIDSVYGLGYRCKDPDEGA